MGMSLDYLDVLTTVVDDSLEFGIDQAPSIFWAHTEGVELPVKKWAHGVVSAPVFTYAEARYFLEYAKLSKVSFEPNDEEETPYQIPEVVLGGPAQDVAKQLLHERLLPIFGVFFGVLPKKIMSAQLAWYTPDGVTGTDWHVDADSDMTCVVSLDPSMYTGGGTALRPHGPCDVDVQVPALPAGHGLFFNGKFTFHKGLPVTSGDRILLV